MDSSVPASGAVDRLSGETFTNDFGLQFRVIPAGEFWMGATEEEVDDAFNNARQFIPKIPREWFTIELPRHRVILSCPFAIGVHQVTQRQWRTVAETLPRVDIDLNPSPATFSGDDLPVEMVSWIECMEFIRRLNVSDSGRTYVLPTEAQWEYACRAGATTPFWFGKSVTTDQVNFNGAFPYKDSPEEPNRRQTVPVGSLNQPNDFGLHDMHGNVWEWCADIFDSHYYWVSPALDPTGPGDGDCRVIRGGSWDRGAGGCRSSSRYGFEPAFKSSFVGFRLAVKLA